MEDKKLEHDISELSNKILKGMQIAVRKLVEETAASDGSLVISEDGEIKNVPAKILLLRFTDDDDPCS
jgi:hypothetical protein